MKKCSRCKGTGHYAKSCGLAETVTADAPLDRRDRSYTALAKRFGMSRPWVKKVEQRALLKMKNAFESGPMAGEERFEKILAALHLFGGS